MKSYWLSQESKYRVQFKRYAAIYGTQFPDDAQILVVTDDDEKVWAFSVLDVLHDSAEILFFYIFNDGWEMGCGSYMLDEIENALKDSDTSLIRCLIPDYAGYPNLFAESGFDIFPAGKEYAVTYGALRYSETYAKRISGKKSEGVKSVSECSSDELQTLVAYLKQKGLPDEGIDKDHSVASFTKGNLNALILCEKKAEGIIIDFIQNNTGDAKHILNCFRKLDHVLSECSDVTDDTKIYIATDNGSNRKLAETLIGDNVNMEEIVRRLIAVKLLA